MKSIFNKLTLIIVSVIMLSSCSKTEKLATETLEERISKDVSLRMAVDNAVSLYTTVSRTYINNPQMSEELEILATKINNKTATSNDYKRVEEIVGVPYDVFIGKLKDFALSLHELNKKYPELSKMKQASLQATLTKAIDLNPTLKK